MPRVHKSKARKDYPENGIKKGETYYWWYAPRTHRGPGRSPKVRSRRMPRSSQLTASPFLREILSVEEEIGDERNRVCDNESLNALGSDLAPYIERIKKLGRETEDKYENLPESLQGSSSGELLKSRYKACERIADELERIASDFEGFEPNGSDDDEWEWPLDDLDNLDWDINA